VPEQPDYLIKATMKLPSGKVVSLKDAVKILAKNNTIPISNMNKTTKLISNTTNIQPILP
jgi:hypothetical protein